VVGIVVVSHSDTLAEGVVALMREMSPPQLAVEAAGGIGEAGVLGTSAELVRAAIERAMSEDGVLVLMDLGSALMSAELAVELLEGAAGPVRLSAAPLVEGAVAAAAAAGGGASLDEVAAEAAGALAMKRSQIGADAPEQSELTAAAPAAAAQPLAAAQPMPATQPPAAAEPVPATQPLATAEPVPATQHAADAEAELTVANEIGLHARPAARFVETVRRYDAEVLVARADSGAPPLSARSLTNLVALGARRGDAVRVLASGPQAREVIAALRELAADGFGDGLPERAAKAPAPGTELRGIGASAGVAIGSARALHRADAPPSRPAGDPESERALLERGLAAAGAGITADRERLRASGGGAEAEIFDAHLALLDDPALLEPALAEIAAGTAAELAIARAGERVADIYRGLDNPLLAERAADVTDVARRIGTAITPAAGEESRPITAALHEQEETDLTTAALHQHEETDPTTAALHERRTPTSPNPNDNGSHSQILVAEDLTPSQTAGLDRGLVAGIAIAHGSRTAHAAIIARALGIPAVVGLGDAILAVPDGTPILLDGGLGSVVVAPDAERLSGAHAQDVRQQARQAAAGAHAREPCELASGERIEVFANIGDLADARTAVAQGAEGVGLLRTEFLFLDRRELPGEEEQVEALREIAGALEGRPLIVRTLDAGADKPLPALPLAREANPFLGVRGIRVGLRRPDLLATQLRAVLRVAAEHPLRLMLPMVATLAEIEAVRELLEQARKQTGVRAPLELGIMVEVPAAALMAAELAPQVDFFSLGTNDLTQYTMAAERGNAALEPLLAEPQPAVLRLVQATVAAAAEHGRWVGVCGEMAGDPAAAALLVGLGVRELSMSARLIPTVKQALRGVTLERAQAAAALALGAAGPEQAREHGLGLL
jgi:phosphocarrier protein FPr